MFGPTTPDPAMIVPRLQSLIERLADPDLTAIEARALRTSLLDLLDSAELGATVWTCSTADRSVSRGAGRCARV